MPEINNTQLYQRITKVETKVGFLQKGFKKMDEKIDNILENYLPSIKKEIAILTVKVSVGAFLAALIGSLLVELVFKRLGG